MIRQIIEKDNPSVEELIACLEQVKKNGDVVVLKFDGERTSFQYTIFITFPNSNKEMIRVDEESLIAGLTSILAKYIQSENSSR